MVACTAQRNPLLRCTGDFCPWPLPLKKAPIQPSCSPVGYTIMYSSRHYIDPTRLDSSRLCSTRLCSTRHNSTLAGLPQPCPIKSIHPRTVPKIFIRHAPLQHLPSLLLSIPPHQLQVYIFPCNLKHDRRPLNFNFTPASSASLDSSPLLLLSDIHNPILLRFACLLACPPAPSSQHTTRKTSQSPC
ncbi:hypothetical protein LX36DRAFT_482758 [Colletotrichum falcatum]|nr:hypothetical protein LX36DRAFT_482758 [Colletotrichum falcatum]